MLEVTDEDDLSVLGLMSRPPYGHAVTVTCLLMTVGSGVTEFVYVDDTWKVKRRAYRIAHYNLCYTILRESKFNQEVTTRLMRWLLHHEDGAGLMSVCYLAGHEAAVAEMKNRGLL
jgi:hypothetical protein